MRRFVIIFKKSIKKGRLSFIIGFIFLVEEMKLKYIFIIFELNSLWRYDINFLWYFFSKYVPEGSIVKLTVFKESSGNF